MMKLKSYFPAFVYSLFVSGYAQILPLDSVLNRIENNNPALIAYQNKIESAEEMVNSARAWMPPVLGVQFGQNVNSFDLNNSTYGLMLSAEQWLPNRKQINAEEDYLESIPSIKRNECEYLKNQYFAFAKEKYLGRYVAERKIEIVKQNIELMKTMIELAEKQLATGMEDLGSIYKMKARLADSEIMLIDEENMIKTLTSALNYVMYQDLSTTFSLDTNNLLKNYRDTGFLDAMDSIEHIRSDIQKMNSEIISMTLNQTLTSLQGKPTFGLAFQPMTTFDNEIMYRAMVTMSIPSVPWSSRGYKSEAKSMGFQIQAMEQDKLAMVNMTGQMINMLIIELNSEYEQVKSYTDRAIPAYKKSFEANLISYSQNSGELMKVILAWDDLQMAQMEYLRHLRLLLEAQTEYETELQIR